MEHIIIDLLTGFLDYCEKQLKLFDFYIVLLISFFMDYRTESSWESEQRTEKSFEASLCELTSLK